MGHNKAVRGVGILSSSPIQMLTNLPNKPTSTAQECSPWELRYCQVGHVDAVHIAKPFL